MKAFLSAAEIAGLNLPGLPDTKRGVLFAATRGSWQSRQRSGRGGGLEYAVDSLPPEARAAYVGRHVAAIEVPTSIARDAAAEPNAEAISTGGAQARDARLAILALLDRLTSTATLAQKSADRYLCDEYNAGHIPVADWIKAEVKRITPRTLARWRSHARKGERSRLAVDRAAARKGTGVLDRANGGEVRNYILALLAKQSQLTAHHIRALVADRFPTVTVPPVRTFQRTLSIWKTSYRVELESIRNPDGFKSTMRFAARVANPASRLNEIWQIDASPADVLTTNGRYTIYVCIDIFSRRLITLVSKTPRASAVGLLLRKAILAWGVPERIKTDNGSDFVANATQRLFAALAIEPETSQAFSPEQKGHIERAIGTMQHGLMRTLAGFIGHSVADRKIIEGRKAFSARLGESPEDMFEVSLSAADLQIHADNWCKDVYGNAPHGGLHGHTPLEVAAMAPGRLRRIEDVRALDMLLAPVAGKDGRRVVTKTGLRINDTHYIGGFLNVGETVLVRMDEHDMGRAYVFSDDGETYLGDAIAPDLAGINPVAAIKAARAEQKRIIDTRMADARREARKIKAADMAPAIHRQALAAAGKLVEFPRAADVHETPALIAAQQPHLPDVPHHSDEVIAMAAQLRAEQAPVANVKPLRTQETSHQRWNRAREIEAAMARKEFVAQEDLLWLGGYQQGSEYEAFALTYGVTPPDTHESSAAENS